MSPQSPKRLLTEEALSQRPADNLNGLSEDIATQLRNVGSRVRKNVTEGYSTNSYRPASSVSVPSSPTKSRTYGRQTSNDILNDVFALSSSPKPLQSPRKRARADSEGDVSRSTPEREEEKNNDDSFRMDEDPGQSLAPRNPPKELPKRAFRQTRSLPVGGFGPGTPPDASVAHTVIHSNSAVEEDWSGELNSTLPELSPMDLS